MRNIKIILILSLLKIITFQETDNQFALIVKAKEHGHDLTNPETKYFHDICLHFRYINKDITLDYRRKHFYFPNNDKLGINSKLISQSPIRNNSNDCFLINNSFSSLFTNYAFICFMPLFIIQFSIVIKNLLIKNNDSISNTPLKKVLIQKKKSNKKKVIHEEDSSYKSTYSEFIPEVDINQIKKINNLEKIDENDKNIHINGENLDLSNQKMNGDANGDINFMKKNSAEPLNVNNKINNENEKCRKLYFWISIW